VSLRWKREIKRIIRDGGKWGCRLFQMASHFMKILKLMVFYEGFKTHGNLQRFLNLWYFNRGSERLFLRFKKIPGNTFPKDSLAGETANLGK